ncbi:hypothetical protein HOLleu_06156 [Holothuria leucospilota]|uniref:Uncharacterized protein n=1 Tax=Holothuria leucospilota TaxID=206669 RepID=A0A9Q1CKU4_HOLLE|nr:hypothetical protein HOLleu_06156 [Holothuria leucospilota]
MGQFLSTALCCHMLWDDMGTPTPSDQGSTSHPTPPPIKGLQDSRPTLLNISFTSIMLSQQVLTNNSAEM